MPVFLVSLLHFQCNRYHLQDLTVILFKNTI
uniref:Uncharacterized protein n=1 Tax=Anguilla anguilla TaxID=7936 RepID=A0A0E9UTX6_ANGAN